MAKIKTPNDELVQAAKNLIARLETVIAASKGATSSPGQFISVWFGDEIIKDMHDAISLVNREGFAYERMNHWKENPDFPVADWVSEVQANETRLGYYAWCQARDLTKYTVVGYYPDNGERAAWQVSAADPAKAEWAVSELVDYGLEYIVVAVFEGHLNTVDMENDASMMEGRRCPVTDCGGLVQYDPEDPGAPGTCLRCGQPS